MKIFHDFRFEMSYISSSRNSSTPSILRKPNKPKASPGPRVRFQFDSVTNLKVLLLNYVQEKNKDAYVDLVCKIRDAGVQLTVRNYFLNYFLTCQLSIYH